MGIIQLIYICFMSAHKIFHMLMVQFLMSQAIKGEGEGKAMPFPVPSLNEADLAHLAGYHHAPPLLKHIFQLYIDEVSIMCVKCVYNRYLHVCMYVYSHKMMRTMLCTCSVTYWYCLTCLISRAFSYVLGIWQNSSCHL